MSKKIGVVWLLLRKIDALLLGGSLLIAEVRCTQGIPSFPINVNCMTHSE